MQPTNLTRYQPVDNGYQIIGSREMFNRALYGSHEHDDDPGRYFTFAGDLPIFMGAVSDWSKHQWCNHAKSGVLMSGVAWTPGVKLPFCYSTDVDMSSRWFHHSEDVVATFRNGWMEYQLRQLSAWFPEVNVAMAVYPLMPEEGFLVHYRITSEQRVIFCAGFGGMTDPLTRFEYAQVKQRHFHAGDCEGNTVTCKTNRALVTAHDGSTLWIGSSFPATVEVGDAKSLEKDDPGLFLASSKDTQTPVVKLFASIGPGETLDGFIVVIRNEKESALDRWLTRDNPIQHLKQQVQVKTSGIAMHTPDNMLNLTVPPTVLAMDASWHKHAFHHGAYGYHAPFLGWRNWYGPTVIGWHDRVKKAIKTHFSEIVKKADGKEAVWWDGKDRPDLDHEGTQYHHIKNSTGRVPAILGKDDIYTMQEVAISMLLYSLGWTGDWKLGKEIFDDAKGVLDWEERILDPDHDGLYQNFLNTWISDGHSYNGGGCAQSSAYNYQANLLMTKLADKLGRPVAPYKKRCEKIRKAVCDKLWLADKGILAEFVDTIGNKLIHDSPELSTIYLAIECGVVDAFQAYQMLAFTETALRNERTLNRRGRLVYSSNWLPKKYSTCGLFPAENLHLALAYFKVGLKAKGLEILDAIVDSYFTGKNPGMAAHVLSAHAVSDFADQDFSDVSSMYLRVMVEGLFGIQLRLLEDAIDIAPNFPSDWTHAALELDDISLHYHRDGRQENLTIFCEKKAGRTVRLPLRSTRIESVLINGAPAEYTVEAGMECCSVVVASDLVGRLHLQILHGEESLPVVTGPAKSVTGNRLIVEASHGTIREYRDDSGALTDVAVDGNKLYATVGAKAGRHTVFVRVADGQYDAWRAVDVLVEVANPLPAVAPDPAAARRFAPLEIAPSFNCSLTEIHTQKYLSPRPKGYSIGVRLNGRYAWDWNQMGHNAVRIDDTALRQAKGVFRSPSGIAFATPESGRNVACVSLWDNFPSRLEIPLSGKAAELALFMIASTNAMQSWVTNAAITVAYRDGSKQRIDLVHLANIDDWLNSALQRQNETVYFSDFNHGVVQRITLNPRKPLAKVAIEAVANEVIIGLLGISVRRK